MNVLPASPVDWVVLSLCIGFYIGLFYLLGWSLTRTRALFAGLLHFLVDRIPGAEGDEVALAELDDALRFMSERLTRP